jgi:hypothetical protein
LKERDDYGDVGLDGRILLKTSKIYNQLCGMGTIDLVEDSVIMEIKLRFHKRLEMSLSAKGPSAFEEGFYSIRLVTL